jgi:hypothetical protein
MSTTENLERVKQTGSGASRLPDNEDTREAIFGSFDGLTSAPLRDCRGLSHGNAHVLVAAAWRLLMPSAWEGLLSFATPCMAEAAYGNNDRTVLPVQVPSE